VVFIVLAPPPLERDAGLVLMRNMRDVILIWFAVHALMFDGAGSDFLAHNLSDSRKPLTQQKSVWYG